MKSKGKVIRVSDEVWDLLAKKRTGFGSWDALLRCLTGLPPRRGKAARLLEFWVVPGSNRLFSKLSEARGEAIKLAVRTGSSVAQPAKVREVL